jgi:hypothetical protein
MNENIANFQQRGHTFLIWACFSVSLYLENADWSPAISSEACAMFPYIRTSRERSQSRTHLEAGGFDIVGHGIQKKG